MMSQDLAFRAEVPAKRIAQLDYILLDSSSSMLSKWYDTLTSIDAYVAGLVSEGVSSEVILHMFYQRGPDYLHRDRMPASEWVALTSACPAPSGNTPLYDAINLMGLRLRGLDPERCSVVIVTDGEDTCSLAPASQARAVLDWLRAKGWCVTFIGAEFANEGLAKALGAGKAEAIGVQQKLLPAAMRNLAGKRGKYARSGDDMHFSEAEQQQFGGYLAPPPSKPSPWSA